MNRKKEKELSRTQSWSSGNPRQNGAGGATFSHGGRSITSHKMVDGGRSPKSPSQPPPAGPSNQSFGESSSPSAKHQGGGRKEGMTVVLSDGGVRGVELHSKRGGAHKHGQEPGKAKSKADKKGKQNQGQPTDRKSSNEKSSNPKSFKGTLANKDDDSVLRVLASHRIFELKKRNLSFPNARFFCRLCEYHLDTIEDCEKHLGENRHQRKKEAADCEGILQHIPDPTQDQLQALDAVLERVVMDHGLSSKELQDRQNIVDRLQKFISQFKEGVILQLYGSSFNGVGLKESDVNVELSGKEEPPKLLLDVFAILCKEPSKEFTNVHNDFLAKVPVVNLKDEATGLKVVLAINSQTAILTSSLLHLYSLADPRMRKIAVILRCWAKLCHLDRQEEGTLPPFALSIMAVYFLQQVKPPVLCVFKDPKEAAQQSPSVPRSDPAMVFSEFREQAQNWVSSNKMSVGELWLRLLRFYCLEFDTVRHVVSIRQQNPLPRSEKKWHSKRLAIEDPCLLKKNVATSMGNTLIYEYFQGSLRKAYYYFGLPRNASGESLVSVDVLKELAHQRTAQLLKEHQEGGAKDQDADCTGLQVDRHTTEVQKSSQKETKSNKPQLDNDAAGKGVNLNTDDVTGKGVNLNTDAVTEKGVNVNADDVTGKGVNLNTDAVTEKEVNVNADDVTGKGVNLNMDAVTEKGVNVNADDVTGKGVNVNVDDVTGKGVDLNVDDVTGQGVNVNTDDVTGKEVNVNVDDVNLDDVNGKGVTVNTDDAKLSISCGLPDNIQDQSTAASVKCSQSLTENLKWVEIDLVSAITAGKKNAQNTAQDENGCSTPQKDVVDKSGQCSWESRGNNMSGEEETGSTAGAVEVSTVEAISSYSEENVSQVTGRDRTDKSKLENTCMMDAVQEASESPQVSSCKYLGVTASISAAEVKMPEPTASADLGCSSHLQKEIMCSSPKQKSSSSDEQVGKTRNDTDLKGWGCAGDQTQDVTTKVHVGDVSGDADSDKPGCQGEMTTCVVGAEKADDGHSLEECLSGTSWDRSQDCDAISLEVAAKSVVPDSELSEGTSENARWNDDNCANSQSQKGVADLNTRQAEQNLKATEKMIKASDVKESLQPPDKTPDVVEQKLRSFAKDFAEVIVTNAYHVLQQRQAEDKLHKPVQMVEAACLNMSEREIAEDRDTVPSRSLERHQEPAESVTSSQTSTTAEKVFGCFYKFSEDVFTDGKGPAVICSYCEQEGHLKRNCPEDKLPEVDPLPSMTSEHMSALKDVIAQIMYLYQLTEDDYYIRRNLAVELERFVCQVYPDARFSLFGSSCNGFGFQSSDLDICMTLEDKTVEDLDVAETIENVAKRLKQRRGLYNIVPIPTAKVPIVKFMDSRTRLEGDISLYNILAQRNTELLRHYTLIDPRVQQLGYAIKVFAKECDIGDASRGSLSSYGYILMMLHFLQQCSPPVIPVLQELHPEGQKPELMVEGWNTWFFDEITNLHKVWKGYRKNQKSPGELWLGFFRYYLENFDWKGRVVTIRQKAPLTKFEKLWNGKSLAVEDPFDLSHNLGSGLSRKMNNYIYKTFVNGRVLYGTPLEMNMQNFLKYSSPVDYFFDRHLLCDGKPPNDRGCRLCGKIGHMVKDCPNRRPKKQNKGQDEREASDSQKGQTQEPQNKDSNQAKPSKQTGGNKAEGRKQIKKGKPESAANNSSSLTSTTVMSATVTNSSSKHHASLGHLSSPPQQGHMSLSPQQGHMSLSPQQRRMSSPSQQGHVPPPSHQGHVPSSPQQGHMPPPSHQGPSSSQAGPSGVQSSASTMPAQGTNGSQALKLLPTGSRPPGIPVDVQQLFNMCGGSETSLIPRMTDGGPIPRVKQSVPGLMNLTPEQQINMLAGFPGNGGDLRNRDKESPGRGPQFRPTAQRSPAGRAQEEDVVHRLQPMQLSPLLQQAGEQPQSKQKQQMVQQMHHQLAAQQQHQQQHLAEHLHHPLPQQRQQQQTPLSQQQQLCSLQQQQAFFAAQQQHPAAQHHQQQQRPAAQHQQRPAAQHQQRPAAQQQQRPAAQHQQHPATLQPNHAARQQHRQQQQQQHIQLSLVQPQQLYTPLAQMQFLRGQQPRSSLPHNQQHTGNESHRIQDQGLQQAAHPDFLFPQQMRPPAFVLRMPASAASTPSPSPPTATPTSRQQPAYAHMPNVSSMSAASRAPFMPACITGTAPWVLLPRPDLQNPQNQQDRGSDPSATPNHHPGSS